MYGLNSKVPPIFSFFYKNVVKLTHTRDRYERNRLRRGFKRLFTSDQDYYVFSRIPVNEHTQIYVDFMEPKNPYLLLVYRNRVKVNSYWTEHTDKTITGIVGINDDGRLFCNLLPNDRVFVLELKEGNWFNHYKLLGYENEYNSGEPICLPKYKPVRVRVQGDLVFIITKWDIEELKNWFKGRIERVLINHIYRSVEELCYNRLVEELLKLRVNCALRDNSVVIPCTRLDYDLWRDIYDFLRDFTAKTLNKYVSRFHLKVNNVSITEDSPFGFNETEIRVSFSFVPNDKFENLVVSHYKSLIEEILDRCMRERVDREIRVGNHIVKARAYPHQVNVRFFNFVHNRMENLNIDIDRETLITDSEVIVDHDEHKPVRVNLVKEEGCVYLINFDNTLNDEREALIRNRFTLKRLISKGLNHN